MPQAEHCATSPQPIATNHVKLEENDAGSWGSSNPAAAEDHQREEGLRLHRPPPAVVVPSTCPACFGKATSLKTTSAIETPGPAPARSGFCGGAISSPSGRGTGRFVHKSDELWNGASVLAAVGNRASFGANPVSDASDTTTTHARRQQRRRLDEASPESSAPQDERHLRLGDAGCRPLSWWICTSSKLGLPTPKIAYISAFCPVSHPRHPRCAAPSAASAGVGTRGLRNCRMR